MLYRHLGMKIGKYCKIKAGVTIEYPHNIQIGDRVSIQHNCFLSGYGAIEIGSDVSIAQDVSILSSTHDYLACEIIRDAPLKSGKIRIENNVWIGMKVSIFHDLIIHSGCIIAANSVVSASVEDNSIVGGAPARLIKKRTYL